MFALKAKVEVPLKRPLGFFFPNVFSYCLFCLSHQVENVTIMFLWVHHCVLL